MFLVVCVYVVFVCIEFFYFLKCCCIGFGGCCGWWWGVEDVGRCENEGFGLSLVRFEDEVFGCVVVFFEFGVDVGFYGMKVVFGFGVLVVVFV